MANARKCDRCGMCFEYTPLSKIKNPVFHGIMQVRNPFGRWWVPENEADEFLYLCPNCRNEFYLFTEKEWQKCIEEIKEAVNA